MVKFPQRPVVFVAISFILWRIILIILAAISPVFISTFGDKFPYKAEFLLKPYYESWFWVWGNFDGVHYLRIAKEWYSAQYSQAFFPLYPVLTGLFGRLFQNEFLVAGFLISNFAFFGALFLFFKLISEEFNLSTAKKAVVFLLLFPASFYFGAIYTEGLFLLEIVACFYLAKKGNWLASSILGFFASLTRFVGVFLFPALIVEYYFQNKEKFNTHNTLFVIRNSSWLLLVPAGSLVYMVYLGFAFHDPFYFLTSQPAFNAQRTTAGIVLFPQVVWRYLKILFSVNPASLPFFNAIFEFATAIVFLILILISFVKTRLSWAVFSFLVFITPTLTGTFSSMPRYVLVCFSAFLVLAQIKNKLLLSFILVLFVFLLGFSVILFTRGYWVA